MPMKIWTDASKTHLCYVFETDEMAIAPIAGDVPVNQAEYIALTVALRDCLQRGIKNIEIYTDSQVLAYQLTGRYKCRAPNLRPLRSECYQLLSLFERWSITWTKREDNKAGVLLERLGARA